ncbi:hypothetical protein PIB30_033914 [Stylosanthes scabra]|uniref:non-specific serine/threonine protein kinase n=1 Tax=Stylosanthes scabra TaxID=79078 RepID=A0ABU6WAY5_9FABA|nr:hypothetical protein [Stylosanthes scabra]
MSSNDMMDFPLPPSPPPTPPPQLHLQPLNLDNLKALKILGKGAMGTVFLVQDTSSTFFALKVVEKTTLHGKLDADRRARWEIEVLSKLSGHPFLPSLLGSLDTPEFLAWALPYCPGGDLNRLRYRQTDRVFSPCVIRFYLAEILCALHHLHSLGIAYRDLKPENVLIQQNGHVTLTDFDLSRKLTRKTVATTSQSDVAVATDITNKNNSIPPTDPNKIPSEPPHRRRHRRNFTRWFPLQTPDAVRKNALKKVKSARVSPVSRRRTSFVGGGERSNSFVGTEEYVAPEVVRGEGHDFAVDWWALGILAYEMMYGTTPFKGKNRKDTFRNVLVKSPEFVGKRWSLTDLIEKLLEKDPTARLGYTRGADEIKEHKFFHGVRWDMLTEVVRPPFIPARNDPGAGESMESLIGGEGGVNIRDYFQKLRLPPSLPPSPLHSPSGKFKRNVSLSEF